MQTEKKQGLTRDTIKYIAIFTMLLNHIANVLLPENTILWEVFIDIGYFTAITMCYFLVEGFYYTHSRRKYGERLLIFAGISQVPYMMAFDFSQLNMIFTLFICFMILVIQDKMIASKWRVPLTIILLGTVHLFGLGNPGTCFYSLVSCRLGKQEENGSGLWNRSSAFCSV